ncbi:MAG: flagellar protein FlaG [Chromatiales bacterium]
MIDSLFFNGASPARHGARVSRDRVRPAAATQAVSLQGKSEGERNSAQFAEALHNASEQIQSTQRTLRFSVDKASGTMVIKVIDSETKEMIRQIPSEEMLVIASRLEAAITGVLLDEQA